MARTQEGVAQFPRAAIAERLMGPLGAVPVNPVSNGGAGFGEATEVGRPDAFLFETTKEAFDDAALFRRIWGDKLLTQSVITTSGAEATRLEDQAIIAIIALHHGRRTIRTEGAKARQAGFLERTLGFLGATAQGKLKPGYFTIIAIDLQHR